MTPKPQIIRNAKFQTPGLEVDFVLARINASKFIFQAATNGTPEYSTQLNGPDAPNHFFDEVVTFLANRLQVQLRLNPEATQVQPVPPPQPKPKPKLEVLKAVPEDLK